MVIPAGEEARALAPLPLSAQSPPHAPASRRHKALRFGGLAASAAPAAPLAPGAPGPHRTLWRLRISPLAALPPLSSPSVSASTASGGSDGRAAKRCRPLVPAGVEEAFEESLDLEWPIDGLEPLSFVLARLFEPLCDRLERGDRGAVVLRVTLTLVTGYQAWEGGHERHERVLELPAPMRDARVLRTLALLDLESNPPPAAIDRVAVGVDVAEGRVLQFGLFARALPTERWRRCSRGSARSWAATASARRARRHLSSRRLSRWRRSIHRAP